MHMHRSVALIIGGCFAVLAVIVSLLFSLQHFTGLVSIDTQPGISHMNLSVNVPSSSWFGVFGNVSATGASNGSFLEGDVLPLNLSFSAAVTDTRIVASVSSTPNWNNLTPASLAQINTFLGLAGADPMSAHNTFTDLVNVTIDNTVYELWSATLVANVSSTTGALISDGELLFVTTLQEDMMGFDGSVMDYQLLLPSPISGNANYSFFVFNQDELPPIGSLSCNQSINLSAILGNDNVSVDLSWDAVVGATGYEVLYVNGTGDGYLNFSTAVTVNVGAATSWSDGSNPPARFYRIRVSDGSTSCIANETGGRIVEALSPNYNLFSTPFATNTIKETLRSIDGLYNNINEFDNIAKAYKFYIIVGNSVFKNFNDITPGKGYWIRTTQNSNLLLTGILVNNISEALSPDYNLVGFPLIDNSAHDDTIEYVFSSINGSFDNINEFNNTAKAYDFYIIVGNSVFKNFDDIAPGKGYWVRMTQNDTVVYQND